MEERPPVPERREGLLKGPRSISPSTFARCASLRTPDVRVTQGSTPATQASFPGPRAFSLVPGLSDPSTPVAVPPARVTILKFMCSDERHTMWGGGVYADWGSMPGSGEELRRQEGKSSRLWAPPLCAEIPHCFAPSATVGESGGFFSFSFTLRARCRRVSRGPRRNNRKPGGQPLSPGNHPTI